MYFGYFISGAAGAQKVELAIASDRPSNTMAPIPMAALRPSQAGLYFMGLEESFRVSWEADNSIVISPVKPSKLYLTPNRPEKPGFAVSKIRVSIDQNGTESAFFDRDKGWEEFLPNQKDY